MLTFLFDVDGVLTDLKTPDVIHPQMIECLMNLLKQNIPMGFITGRAMWWLRPQFIKRIEDYVVEHTLDKNILDLLYISGEFGAVRVLHKNGKREELINKELMITEDLRNTLTEHAEKFKSYVSVEEKKTLFTVHRNDDVSEEEFERIKPESIASFKRLLQNFPEVEVISDRIAINIRYKNANKKKATDDFIAWLTQKEFSPEKYFVFGDSPTDLEMGLELEKQKLSFEFIYIGVEDDLEAIPHAFPVIVTKNRCDQGTREYLSSYMI